MRFYDLSKEAREKFRKDMEKAILRDLSRGDSNSIIRYASDSDTYIRKNAYQIIARIYMDRPEYRKKVIKLLRDLYKDSNEKIRQTVVYALGEIGRLDFDAIEKPLERALDDGHHSVINAVVGAMKRMGEKNPKPTIEFAKRFLDHRDPNIRRQMVHGLELRGRTHPEEVLPLLKKVQFEQDTKVRKMMVHVISQMSYKEGCLEKVVEELKGWQDRELVEDALKEILIVHKRYHRFSPKSYKEAKDYIEKEFGWAPG